MPEWDIQVGASRGHIHAAEGHFEQLGTHRATLQAALDAAAGACKSGPIAGAILEAAARLTGATQSALTRAENAAAGTRDAISAYAAGDLEMAANAQQFSGVSADF